jgi:hypothetical protein
MEADLAAVFLTGCVYTWGKLRDSRLGVRTKRKKRHAHSYTALGTRDRCRLFILVILVFIRVIVISVPVFIVFVALEPDRCHIHLLGPGRYSLVQS